MTSKIKNILLVGVFILTLVLCYALAIKNTFDLKTEYAQLKTETDMMVNATQQLALLMQKQKHNDSILNHYQLQGKSIQNNLLNYINTYAVGKTLKVVDFLEPHISASNGLNIKTYRFSLEGEFASLQDLIYRLEQDTKFGEVISVNFEKKLDYKINKSQLTAKILIQSY